MILIGESSGLQTGLFSTLTLLLQSNAFVVDAGLMYPISSRTES